MKKITLLLLLFITSVSSFAIVDGTYPLTGAPFTGTITFDNTAQEFTITITNSPTTGYLGIGFSDTTACQMDGKYALYITKSDNTFQLSEQILTNFATGTTLTTQATIESQNFANGDITIKRSYTATNGGFSFTGNETSLNFISAKGNTAGAYHGGSNRFKGTVSIGSLSTNQLPELIGLQAYTKDNSIELKFPETAKGIYNLEVLNSIGQTILTKELNSNTPSHPLSKLSSNPAGIYFIRLNKN